MGKLTRSISLCGWLLAAASVAGADIVVLTTGEHMDVESYEIKGGIVIIQTWDGRFRNLPATYVDLEATKKANDHAKPEQEIAPARLEKARIACESYGVRNAVKIYYEVMDGQIQRLRGHTSIRAYDQLRGGFRNAFEGDRIFDLVTARFAENANHDLLDAWTAWLESPLASKMVNMETVDFDNHEEVAAGRYWVELKSDKARYDTRVDLANRLDLARKSSESTVEVVMYLLEAFFLAVQKVFPDEDLDLDPDEQRNQLYPIIRDANVRGYVLLFRDASDKELADYIEFWESRDGQRVSTLMNAALEAGARQGSEVAIEMMAGKRQHVP